MHRARSVSSCPLTIMFGGPSFDGSARNTPTHECGIWPSSMVGTAPANVRCVGATPIPFRYRRTCYLPSLTAAATLPKWGFPQGNGTCCDLVVQPVCIGCEIAWWVGPLNRFASTGLLLNRCCGRENGTKSLIMKAEKSRFESKTTRGADRGLAHLTMHGDCIDECPAETSHPTGPKSNLGRRCLSATCSRFRLYPRRIVNW
jgi:hypothetical protein